MNSRLAFLIAAVLVAASTAAQDIGSADREQLGNLISKRPYSPYAGRGFATRVFWGDTHLHTGFSMDAGAFGARLTPADAYRFAKGEEVTASSGQPVKLGRALDLPTASPNVPSGRTGGESWRTPCRTRNGR